MPNKLTEARERFLAASSPSYYKEPLNQVCALLLHYRRIVDRRAAATDKDSQKNFFHCQAEYRLSAFDRSGEAGEQDGGESLDLSSTLSSVLDRLYKIINNLSCSAAFYFWMQVDSLIAFCQRVVNACFVFVEFACHVLTHFSVTGFDLEFLRDLQRVDVQTNLDNNLDALTTHLAILTGPNRL